VLPVHTGWDSFFLGELGAAAALAGLLVVAISINIEQILKYSRLPRRAVATIALLLGVVLMSGLALVPGQSLRLLGVEVLAISGAIWGMFVRNQIKDRQGGEERFGAPHVQLLLEQVATVPPIVAGIILIADSTAGLGVLAAGFQAVFVVAVSSAWVLLVEIRR
jgi:modulator of FtsH protease